MSKENFHGALWRIFNQNYISTLQKRIPYLCMLGIIILNTECDTMPHPITVLLWPYIEGILPKGSYRPCVSMAGRALLTGYPQYVVCEVSPLLIKYDAPFSTNHLRSCHLWHFAISRDPSARQLDALKVSTEKKYCSIDWLYRLILLVLWLTHSGLALS